MFDGRLIYLLMIVFFIFFIFYVVFVFELMMEGDHVDRLETSKEVP